MDHTEAPRKYEEAIKDPVWIKWMEKEMNQFIGQNAFKPISEEEFTGATKRASSFWLYTWKLLPDTEPIAKFKSVI